MIFKVRSDHENVAIYEQTYGAIGTGGPDHPSAEDD